MRELLEYLARGLVDEPDAGRGRASSRRTTARSCSSCPSAEDDYGKVIGRGGRTANALRTVVKAAARQGEPPRARRHRRLTWLAAVEWLHAGRVGRPHGLDGSFHVTRPRGALLALGARRCGSAARDGEIVRRAGTDERPILRLDGVATARAAPRRCAARTCSCRAAARPRSSEDECWAEDLEGCAVVDGDRRGRTVVRACCALPSCEVLRGRARRRRRAARPAGRATRSARRRRRRGASTSTSAFLGESRAADADRRLHALPRVVRLVRAQRHVAQRARAQGHELRTLNYRDHTPLSGGQVDDTPFGGGAGMVLRVDVMDAALRALYGVDPVDLRAQRRVIALTPGGRMLDDALVDELAAEPALTLLCGRYEGFDERIVEHFASDARLDRALRARRRRAGGDGRLRRGAAQAARRARPRRVGASRSRSAPRSSGGPEYPHYTRPAEYRGWRVPEVLLSGHHEEIRQWRRARSRERGAREPPGLATMSRRRAGLARPRSSRAFSLP